MLNPIFYYRLSRRLYVWGVPLIPRVVDRFSQLLFHCYLPHTAELGEGFEVGYHGIGIVVHSKSRIGTCVFLGPGVVIGGRSQLEGVPIIEDNVYIAAGAKVLGDIIIGHGSVIGANAVVIQSVPSRSVAVGVPARIVKRDVDSYALAGWPPKP